MTSNIRLAEVPEPRRVVTPSSPYGIAFVCLGNICRSPTAQVVMTTKVADAGLADLVRVRSSGTGTWHLGEAMDRRAAAALAQHGYDPSQHRATMFDSGWIDEHDLILAMDGQNYRDVGRHIRSGSDRDRVMMFRRFDPVDDGSLDVPDPWYAGDESFATVLAIVERTCDRLVKAVADRVS